MNYVFATSWNMKEKTGYVNQYEMNELTGELNLVGKFLEGIPVGTVFANNKKKVLYAVREERSPAGGYIYSMKIAGSGHAEILSEARTFAPCTSYFGLTDGYAIVSNHSCDGFDATVNLFKLEANGAVGEMLDKNLHTEKGILEKQTMSHPHCAVFSPDKSLCAVCDKGSDIVRMYKISEKDGDEKLEVAAKWKAGDGYSPRYAAFHPQKQFFYHNNETCGKVCAYKYTSKEVIITKIGDYNATESAYAEQQGLAIHPSGEYLYTIVKSEQSIVVFNIDQDNGKLSVKQTFQGKYQWPRHIEISPNGRFAVVTYHIDGKLVVYRIENGALAETGFEYDLPLAAGVAFMRE